jgi:predicted ATP-binding protein involved in virulence
MATHKQPKKPAAVGNGPRRHARDIEAVYFLSFSLENLRCFGPKQTLHLADRRGRPAQWTVLLGNNGTGKTTILQAMAVLSEVTAEHSRFRNPPRPDARIPPISTRGEWLENRSHGFFRDTAFSVRVFAELACGALLLEANQPVRKAEMCMEREADRWILLNHTLDRFAPPVCCGYGAARRLGDGSFSEADTPTATLFSYQADLRNAEEWLLRLDYSASKKSASQEQQKHRLEQIQQLLLAILPEVDGFRFDAGVGVHPTPHVEFQTPYGWVPLRQLGYGYQTLIAWMVDLAGRMAERYPDSPDPLAEPAVVLVDEIDLHLHPTWQRKLIGYLSERFPNTQFIVTAHSPLVVQAAVGANIAVLRREGDHVVIDNDAKTIRGWRIDQVLTSDLFGLPSARPPELDEPLARRKALLSQAELSEEHRRELAELEKRIGELPSGETAEQAQTLALLQESLDLLRTPQATKA